MKKMQSNKITTLLLALSASLHPAFMISKAGFLSIFPCLERAIDSIFPSVKTVLTFNKRLHLCYTFCSKYF